MALDYYHLLSYWGSFRVTIFYKEKYYTFHPIFVIFNLVFTVQNFVIFNLELCISE